MYNQSLDVAAPNACKRIHDVVHCQGASIHACLLCKHPQPQNPQKRYRSLAGAAARAVRLDLLLLAAHHAASLARSSHLCEPDEVAAVHPAVGALTRAAGRAAAAV